MDFEYNKWLTDFVFNNQFLIGGIGTVIVGSLTYLARAVPLRIWNGFLRVISVDFTINNDSDTFPDVIRYAQLCRIKALQRTFMLVDDCNASRRVRSLIARDHGDVHRDPSTIGPGLGPFLGWFDGRLMLGRISLLQSQGDRFKMTISLRFFGRDHGRVTRFLHKAEEARAAENCDTIAIEARSGYEGWRTVSRKAKRSFDTVFLETSKKALIRERVQWFLDNEAWYRQRGLTWRYGLLLTGKPGTGKTSLVHAIASECDKNIRMLSFNTMRDNDISNFVSETGEVLVIEDIDTFNITHDRETNGDGDKGSPTIASLSTILNVLDGLYSPDGTLIIATTNHIDNIDPAIVRKGRFDLTVDIGALCPEAFTEMFKAYYGDDDLAREFVGRGHYHPITGAEAQDLFRHHAPEKALKLLSQMEKPKLVVA